MNAQVLESALIAALGETQEDKWSEWWDTYTGLNAFYHLLADVEYEYTELHTDAKKIADGVVEVNGLGVFERVEVYEDNFDTYERTCDNFLVFKFQGHTYRVEGHLDSHMGGVWDGRLEEVEPVEVTKIEYRSI